VPRGSTQLPPRFFAYQEIGASPRGVFGYILSLCFTAALSFTHDYVAPPDAPPPKLRINAQSLESPNNPTAMGWLFTTMAIPPVLIVLLHALSFVLPKGPARLVAFAAFCLTSFICMCLCASYGVIASIALRCVGYGGLSQWTVARAFKYTMWLATGVTFRVSDAGRIEGGRRGGVDALASRPSVIVGNHQT
jgi:hypothetical protein